MKNTEMTGMVLEEKGTKKMTDMTTIESTRNPG